MRFSFFAIFAVSIFVLGAGCAWPDAVSNPVSGAVEAEPVATVPESDFSPSVGRADGPGEKGPWINRVALATSADGKTFASTGMVIGDQMDVPDLVRLPDGTLALYAIAWTAGERSNQMVVARSGDDGKTWTYRYVEIDGMSRAARGPSPADPDVVVREDGAIRLYFTYDAKTHYADSEDGVTFAYGGQSFAPSRGMMLDPTVWRIGDAWHLYGGGGPGGGNWHATSTDGATFTEQTSVRVTGSDGLSYMLSNGIEADGTTYAWGFSNEGTDIERFSTVDGKTFVTEGVSLAYSGGDVEADHVKDSSVIELPNGTFLMAYVTAIPE